MRDLQYFIKSRRVSFYCSLSLSYSRKNFSADPFGAANCSFELYYQRAGEAPVAEKSFAIRALQRRPADRHFLRSTWRREGPRWFLGGKNVESRKRNSEKLSVNVQVYGGTDLSLIVRHLQRGSRKGTMPAREREREQNGAEVYYVLREARPRNK